MVEQYYKLMWSPFGKWEATDDERYPNLARAFHSIQLFTNDEHKIEFKVDEYKNGKKVKTYRRHTVPTYAVYKDDQELGDGTLLELEDQLGLDPKYIQWLVNDSAQKRNHGHMKSAYRLGAVHIDEYGKETEIIY